MNKMASEEGRILSAMYSHSTCSPSRAALLTGIYSWRMGLDGTPFRADIGMSAQFKVNYNVKEIEIKP